MGKELEGLEEDLKTKIHMDSLRTVLKNSKLKNDKVSGSKVSPPSKIDKLSK